MRHFALVRTEGLNIQVQRGRGMFRSAPSTSSPFALPQRFTRGDAKGDEGRASGKFWRKGRVAEEHPRSRDDLELGASRSGRVEAEDPEGGSGRARRHETRPLRFVWFARPAESLQRPWAGASLVAEDERHPGSQRS